MKAQLADLEGKAKASATPEDVNAKLARLAELEQVLENPKAYLKMSKKTLEDIAAAALSGDDTEIADPRVDSVLAAVEELKKGLETSKTETQTQREAERAREAERINSEAMQHASNVLKANPERWELIQSDTGAAAEAVKAARLVYERDYKKADGTYKPVTLDEANAILADCFDQAETFKLAEQLQTGKKNVATRGESLLKRKGLEVQDSESYAARRGDDGKQANGARTPRISIDGERAGIRPGAVKRGPTDVRTARARMLRIAGATDKDEG